MLTRFIFLLCELLQTYSCPRVVNKWDKVHVQNNAFLNFVNLTQKYQEIYCRCGDSYLVNISNKTMHASVSKIDGLL